MLILMNPRDSGVGRGMRGSCRFTLGVNVALYGGNPRGWGPNTTITIGVWVGMGLPLGSGAVVP